MITFPYIRYTLGVMIVLHVIFTFNNFEFVFLSPRVGDPCVPPRCCRPTSLNRAAILQGPGLRGGHRGGHDAHPAYDHVGFGTSDGEGEKIMTMRKIGY